jgi:hypothetical protein
MRIGGITNVAGTSRLEGKTRNPLHADAVMGRPAREALVKMCTLPLLAGENVSAAFVVQCSLLPGRRTVRRVCAGGNDVPITRRSDLRLWTGRRDAAGDARRYKHARYALWKNPDNLTDRQRDKLAWIAKTDPRPHRAYLLKEGLRYVFAVKGDAGKQALDR